MAIVMVGTFYTLRVILAVLGASDYGIYNKELINYVRSRGWTPVVVSPPISPALAKKYNSRVKDIYLDSFIKAIEDTNVLYLDFTYDMMFTESHFQNALCLNKKGAQLFTKELIDQRGGVIPSS